MAKSHILEDCFFWNRCYHYYRGSSLHRETDRMVNLLHMDCNTMLTSTIPDARVEAAS